MAKPQLDHIHLFSPDPEAAAAFYVEHLGAELVCRRDTGERLRVTIRLGGLPLMFDRTAIDTLPRTVGAGLDHFALKIDDLDSVLAELDRKGVPIVDGPRTPRPGRRVAFVAAPDGVRVELAEDR